MKQEINLVFRYSRKDYVRAVRTHLASRLRLKLDISVIILTVAGGAYLLKSPETMAEGKLLIEIAAGFCCFLALVFAILPDIWFRTQPKLRDEYALTFSENGIRFRTIHIDSNLQWSMYTHALINRYSYLLYYGTRTFSVLPSRVFESVEQQKSFEQLLAENVQQISRR